MTPVVILGPQILAKKYKGKMFKKLKNYNATITMDTFLERVDLNCLYFDLKQILGPQERFNNTYTKFYKSTK